MEVAKATGETVSLGECVSAVVAPVPVLEEGEAPWPRS